MVDLGQPGHSGAPALSHVEEVPLLNVEHCDFSNLFSCFLANTVIFLSEGCGGSFPFFASCLFSPFQKCFLFLLVSFVFESASIFFFFVYSEAVVFSYLFHASLLLFSCFLQTLLYFFLSMILFSLS